MKISEALVMMWGIIKSLKEAVFSAISGEKLARESAVSNLQEQIDGIEKIDLSEFETYISEHPISID